MYASQNILLYSLNLCLFWENVHTQINGTAEERGRPHLEMQLRLWNQNDVSKGLMLDTILGQLIPVHTNLFFKYLMLSTPVYPNYSFPLKLSNIYFGELLPSPKPSSVISASTHISVPKSVVACLTGFRARIPQVSWMSVSFECVGGLITRPEEPYRMCVSDCDIGTSIRSRSWPSGAVQL